MRKKRERTRASGRRVCEKEEREKERERGERRLARGSERSERVTRVTTLWRGVKNTSTRRESDESDNAMEGSEE